MKKDVAPMYARGPPHRAALHFGGNPITTDYELLGNLMCLPDQGERVVVSTVVYQFSKKVLLGLV